MNRGRRSMGTKPQTAKPQRSSSGNNFNPPQPSSALRSRLPKATGGPQSGQKRDSGSAKRSSSNDHRTTAALGQFGSQNAFRTPRSKSATRTPSSGRPPLSSIQFNSALRSPHTGKRSSVYGHHGQQKDTRDLNDRQKWQIPMAKDLVNFCISANPPFPNQQMIQSHADIMRLSTSTFKALFEYLIQFVMPDYTLQLSQANPMEKVLPELLKKMNYPGPLNKSHFQTIGGNNISKNLGVLHFLLTLAKFSRGICDTWSKINFPNTDQDGFAIDDYKKSPGEIEYNFFMAAYKTYNDGGDEYPDELQILEEELLDSMDVQESHIRDLKRELNRLETEHQSLKEPSSEIDKLNEESVKTLDDIKGLQDYLEKRQKYFTSKQVELKGVQENVKKLNDRMEQLKQCILMLESECLAKNIDPKDTSNHAQEFVMALKQRVESKKAEVNDADKMKWQYEQSLSKKAATIDNLKHEFNKLLINFNNIEDASRLREVMDDTSLVANLIQDFKQNLKEEQIEIEKDLKKLRESLQICKQELSKRQNELSQANQEEMDKKKEKTKILEKNKSEEDDLKKKLELAKKKLRSHHGEKDRVTEDLQEKKRQLQIALEEKQKQEDQLKLCKQQGEEFIRRTMNDMHIRREKLKKERDEGLTKYQEDCQKMSSELKKGIAQAKKAQEDVEIHKKALKKLKDDAKK